MDYFLNQGEWSSTVDWPVLWEFGVTKHRSMRRTYGLWCAVVKLPIFKIWKRSVNESCHNVHGQAEARHEPGFPPVINSDSRRQAWGIQRSGEIRAQPPKKTPAILKQKPVFCKRACLDPHHIRIHANVLPQFISKHGRGNCFFLTTFRNGHQG